MSAPRSRWLLPVVGVLAAGALGARVYVQLGALEAARGDLADAQTSAADLHRTLANGIGPPILDATADAPASELRQALGDLGLRVEKSAELAATPAGPHTALARFTVSGHADAAGLDRVLGWIKANSASMVLDRLAASADANGGGSAVTLELDAIVRTGRRAA